MSKNFAGWHPPKKLEDMSGTNAVNPKGLICVEEGEAIIKPMPKTKLEIHGEFVLDWKTLDSEAFREYIIDIVTEAVQKGRLSLSNSIFKEKGPLL